MESNQDNSKFNWNNNIVLGIVIIIFSTTIAYKIIQFDFTKFSFEKIDFSTLLSVVLALFSVALAVAFYFKASDSSNKFYDNIYKFTQDVSTNLGKIEVGFGEKLTNLNEGYRDLGQRIYQTPTSIYEKNINIKAQEYSNKQTKIQKVVGLFSDKIINDFKTLVTQESEFEVQATEAEKLATLLDYSSFIYLKTHFEFIYENIFGSQIALLQYLNSVPQNGDTFEHLKAYYDQAVERYPGRFDEYPYENYIDFLIKFDLINKYDNIYKASEKATDFLSYLNWSKKSLSKQF